MTKKTFSNVMMRALALRGKEGLGHSRSGARLRGGDAGAEAAKRVAKAHLKKRDKVQAA